MNKNVKYIIESLYNFDPGEYQDEEDNVLDNQTVSSSITRPWAKTREARPLNRVAEVFS